MKKIRNILLLLCMLIGLKWLYDTNVTLTFTRHSISFTTLPESFNRFKIAHISDFHNAQFGNVRESILQGIKAENPNMIVITGDLIDSRTTKINVALNLVAGLVAIAPCYYVTGNHEARLDNDDYERLEEGLVSNGVVILRNREVILAQGGNKISLIGIDDPLFTEPLDDRIETISSDKINELGSDELFTVLLSHRPEYYDIYKNSKVNLAFTGHAHGGQFRLPFIGGVYVPNQGFFPKYDAGVYQENEFAMVVSRGIGNSLFPIRLNNQPEVVMVELTKQKG